MNATFDQIAQKLTSAHRILVASHIRPDADAFGSTLAMTLWLRAMNKDVTAWNSDGMNEKFHYLPNAHLIEAPIAHPGNFDLLLALDTSVKARLGHAIASIESQTTIINIDHHISNERFGHLNYIDPSAPAAGQILFDFLKSQNATISPAIATNLFAAISTDTGSFQYSGVTPHTFEVAAELIRCGVDVAELSRQIYQSQPKRRFDLLRHALNNTHFICNDQAAYFSLSLADIKSLAVSPEDNEGIIDQLRAIDSVLVAVFFEELPENKVRVSSRSKDPRIDVCKICQAFGGGGHPQAAGTRMSGSFEEAQTRFMQLVKESIETIAL